MERAVVPVTTPWQRTGKYGTDLGEKRLGEWIYIPRLELRCTGFQAPIKVNGVSVKNVPHHASPQLYERRPIG